VGSHRLVTLNKNNGLSWVPIKLKEEIGEGVLRASKNGEKKARDSPHNVICKRKRNFLGNVANKTAKRESKLPAFAGPKCHTGSKE